MFWKSWKSDKQNCLIDKSGSILFCIVTILKIWKKQPFHWYFFILNVSLKNLAYSFFEFKGDNFIPMMVLFDKLLTPLVKLFTGKIIYKKCN